MVRTSTETVLAEGDRRTIVNMADIPSITLYVIGSNSTTTSGGTRGARVQSTTVRKAYRIHATTTYNNSDNFPFKTFLA